MSKQANWDMTAFFPSFGGPEYTSFRDQLERDVGDLRTTLENLGPLSPETRETWVAALARTEETFARHRHLGSYLGCLAAADARDAAVKKDTAWIARVRADLQAAFVRIRAAFGESDDGTFAELLATGELSPVAHFLERSRERARFSMSTDLEGLAAELDVTGLSAWGRLYSQVSGTLEFDLEVSGQPTRRLPASQARSLLGDSDAAVRRATLEGANQAWEGISDTVAACLNAISGTRLALYRRRGVAHFLDPALVDSAVTRPTVSGMFDVARARAEIPRRFLREKARRLGKPKLGFQDLEAPAAGELPTRVPWKEAQRQIVEAFSGFYPALGEFAEMAFDRKWIDYEPRPGKQPGGFCSSSLLIGESRVFMTYDGALGDVSTLAHELGHAWHSWLMRDMRPWARTYPMTLAETASTFAEQIVLDSVLAAETTTPQEKQAILDSRLQAAAAFLLNIPVRFDFESAVYTERANGELGAEQLCQLMLDAQRSWYADALAEEELDPWFWASKLHFYIAGLSFYNFPYTFGYLFSLGIFARAKSEGPDFLPRYEDLLRATGSAPAESVARDHLGVDLERQDFWNESVDLIQEDLEAYLRGADAP